MPYRREAGDPIPVGALARAFGRPDSEIREILGAGGLLARALPGYRERTSQIEFAEFVARTLKMRSLGVAEAGCGVGKSIGYLVPVVRTVPLRKPDEMPTRRTVISTGTLALQDQLRDKDLPFLDRTLGGRHPFEWCVLKGKSNYVCALKTQKMDTLPLGCERYEAELGEWLRDTETGDLGEVSFDLTSPALRPLRDMLTIEEDDCPGQRQCPVGDRCWAYAARRRAAQADLVITNHALLVLDLVLGGQLLPPYDQLIVDEAHQLEDYARGALERILSPGRLGKTFRRVEQLGAGYLVSAIRGVHLAADEFFGALDRHLDEKGLRRGNRAAQVTLVPSQLSPAVRTTANGVQRALEGLAANLRQFVTADPAGEGATLAQRLEEEATSLALDFGGLHEQGVNRVLWAEIHPRRATALRITPIEVGPFLKAQLWQRTPRVAAVLCSGTLTTGPADDPKAFDHVQRRLGVEQASTIRLASPYDYRRQALYYLPDVQESPQAQRGEDGLAAAARYARAIAPHVQEVLLATRGRAFVLFTSYGVLRATRPLVRVPYPVRCQGDEEDPTSKAGLVEWFRSTPGAVLFGTSSFWEGVDVPGEALSCVVIDKIPFPNASDPVEAARKTRMGGAYFALHSVPSAAQRLTQGVMRLIRTETDRGLLVLLDPRFKSANYGARLLATLPGTPVADTAGTPDELITTLCREDLPLVGNFIDGRRS